MSGHSKWSKIKHKKGAADKARSNVFTKSLKAITVAAQEGGADAEMNFSLRLAIDKAKAANVPKDNIARAIKRGTGEDKEGVPFETVVYEAYGPGGVAMLIETLTDNRNRTVSDVKHIVSKHGGSIAGPGSVQWQFEHRGVLRFETEKKNAVDWEGLQLAIMDAGALDIDESEDGVEVQCQREDLQKIIHACRDAHIEPDDSGLEWVAKEAVPIESGKEESLDALLEALDENDDVQEVYTNV